MMSQRPTLLRQQPKPSPNLVDEVRLLRKENRKLTGLIETVQRQMEERPLVLPAPIQYQPNRLR